MVGCFPIQKNLSREFLKQATRPFGHFLGTSDYLPQFIQSKISRDNEVWFEMKSYLIKLNQYYLKHGFTEHFSELSSGHLSKSTSQLEEKSMKI